MAWHLGFSGAASCFHSRRWSSVGQSKPCRIWGKINLYQCAPSFGVHYPSSILRSLSHQRVGNGSRLPPSRVVATQNLLSLWLKSSPHTSWFLFLVWISTAFLGSQPHSFILSHQRDVHIVVADRWCPYNDSRSSKSQKQCTYIQLWYNLYLLKIDPLDATPSCLRNCSDPSAVEPSR